jgi:hypothetical protein
MGVCGGCTQDFPRLDKTYCDICTKLQAALQPVTPEVRKTITVSCSPLISESMSSLHLLQDLPQCIVCGVTFVHLHSEACGRCTQAAAAAEGETYMSSHRHSADHINQRTTHLSPFSKSVFLTSPSRPPSTDSTKFRAAPRVHL